MPETAVFERLCVIGFGLIGGSIARRAREAGLARALVAYDASDAVRTRVRELGIVDEVAETAQAAVAAADCVIVCVPVGAIAGVAAEIAPSLAPGAILSDVGSTKLGVIGALAAHIPPHVAFVPAHPMAGTEFSGPDSGFSALFEGRWVLLTPPAGTDEAAIGRIEAFWRGCGANVERMEAAHHDRMAAMVSHLPHLIAFTICNTAEGLEDESRREVLQFAASGFRDFTRIAASDPVMWRDIFLANREALLEMLARFTEDAQAMARAIRFGDAAYIERSVERGRAIRQSLIEQKQA